MSMYGDSGYNNEKNNLYDELRCFLEDHPISEMLQIVTDVVRYESESEDKVSQELDINDVLDKIRAEIKDRPTRMLSTSIEYERGVNAMLHQSLVIIDKYKVESEE